MVELNKALPVYFDIETDGLYINTSLIQLRQNNKTHFIYVNSDEELAEIKKELQQYHLVGYNLSYDLGTLNLVPVAIDDLFYAVKTAFPAIGKFSLDAVVAYFDLDLYKGLDKKAMQKAGFKRNRVFTPEQLRYAEADVEALEWLYNHKKVQDVIKNNIAYALDIKSLLYAAQYQQNGLLVDQDAVKVEIEKIDSTIEQNYIDLAGLNPNSPKQCKEALGTTSTNKDTLVALMAEGNSLAKLIFDQRRLLKRRNMLESYNFPKVYTKFNPAGAITGRFTASGGDMLDGINAQQITRDLQYLFNQDTDDTVIIEADFSTAELRAAASIMRDAQMYKELKDGMDLHKISATMVTGGSIEDVTKKDRQAGKAVSFGLIFGMSAPSFKQYAFTTYGVNFSEPEARGIKNNYMKRYRGITKYHRNAWDNYETMVVETALGRRVRPKLGTDAINIPIQGTIAETTKMAVHFAVMEDKRILDYIYNVIHDQINLRVPRADVDYWTDLLVRNMKLGWDEICKSDLMFYKDIEMPVDSNHAN
mgnify:CR=1 FL=1|jgi:DNA polymerase-1